MERREIGISTSKVHARGPVGVAQLTSFKYKVLGTGQRFVHKLKKSKKNFVGILGGTFNPPHKGHLFVSNYALQRLNLGEIWWVVTQKNPLKKTHENFQKRLEYVKAFIRNRNIKIMEIYDPKKNIYTIDVLEYLYKNHPNKKFIWLMGVDNLKNFHLWKDWKKIFYNIPIAIFDNHLLFKRCNI